jgi:hypothetical protein
MTGPPPAAPAGQPARDNLTPRVFRALYADYELRTVEGTTYVAVPRGTAWYDGRSIGEIARQISDPGQPDPASPATGTPVPARLPLRQAQAAATNTGPAARPQVIQAGERTA